jgi:hypothetical protein
MATHAHAAGRSTKFGVGYLSIGPSSNSILACKFLQGGEADPQRLRDGLLGHIEVLGELLQLNRSLSNHFVDLAQAYPKKFLSSSIQSLSSLLFPRLGHS